MFKTRDPIVTTAAELTQRLSRKRETLGGSNQTRAVEKGKSSKHREPVGSVSKELRIEEVKQIKQRKE